MVSFKTTRNLKLNWDVVKTNTNLMGIEIIFQNDVGIIIACLCESRPFFSHLVVAKNLSLLIAMEFCAAMGLSWVEFEGDAQLLI